MLLADLEARYEVVVVGAGNAGLAAAISAAQGGAKVAMLEKAGKQLRGGNTYFTGTYRFGWDSLEKDIFPLVPGISDSDMKEMREVVKPYTNEEFYADVMRLGGGRADPDLLQVLVSESLPTIRWLRAMGHEWLPDYGPLTLGMVVTLNGGGARLSDREFEIAAGMGVDVLYENIAMELIRDAGGRVIGVYALTPDGFTKIYGKAVILASGGFEADPAMRAAFLGPGWDNVTVRGVPFNTGDGLRMAWDIGAQAYGNLNSCHASPQDINRPPFSVRIQPTWEYSRYAYPWGISVNIDGQRFIDEGSDYRRFTYAKTGREIVKQPGGVAFQLLDKKGEHLIRGYKDATGGKAGSLEEIAKMLGLEPGPLLQTVREYNQAVQAGPFNPSILDGKCTKGLAINKTNWAQTIDTPPYYGYGVCCGITFTYGGLRINTDAQVLSTWEAPIPGLYACGEIAGGLFYGNYPGASGMMQGAVFGRRAGAHAAKVAKSG